jgi:hypothetical protein
VALDAIEAMVDVGLQRFLGSRPHEFPNEAILKPLSVKHAGKTYREIDLNQW